MPVQKTPPKKMSDIARLAGVSESTVSRALAGSSLISKTTRERIVAIAQKHNYAINKQAQNLRLQTSKTISVIIPVAHEPLQTVSDPFFLELVGAIADNLTAANYDLLLSLIKADDWRARVASHSYVDGLIVVGQSAIHDQLNEFAQFSTLPLVVWGARLSDQHYISVGVDNLEGGKLAVQRLIDQGRRRIVFLGDPSLPEVSLRYEGYRQVLAASGVVLPPEFTVRCGFSTASGDRALKALLESGMEFDAIFAASDVLATISLKHLHAKGFTVPQDISIVGFDDISLASHIMPALTTISQQIQSSGRVLVENLFAQIAGQPASSQVLAPRLIARSSA